MRRVTTFLVYFVIFGPTKGFSGLSPLCVQIRILFVVLPVSFLNHKKVLLSSVDRYYAVGFTLIYLKSEFPLEMDSLCALEFVVPVSLQPTLEIPAEHSSGGL